MEHDSVGGLGVDNLTRPIVEVVQVFEDGEVGAKDGKGSRELACLGRKETLVD